MTPYIVTVYFLGPKSAFNGKPYEAEIIFQEPSSWLWAARLVARKQAGNTGRCGYVISRGEDVIEHVEATNSEYAVL